MHFLAPVARLVVEVAQEQFVVRDDLVGGAVFEIMDGELSVVGAAHLAVLLGQFLAVLLEVVEHVEAHTLVLRSALQFGTLQDLVDAVGGDTRLADGGGQQVRTQDVTGDEVVRTLR